MSVVRVGATKQYSDNWESIFSGKRSSATKTATAAKSKKTAKKSPKKAAKATGKKKAAGPKKKSKKK